MCSSFSGFLSSWISLGSPTLLENRINLLQHLPGSHYSLDFTGRLVWIYALKVINGRRAISQVGMWVTADWMSLTCQPEQQISEINKCLHVAHTVSADSVTLSCRNICLFPHLTCKACNRCTPSISTKSLFCLWDLDMVILLVWPLILVNTAHCLFGGLLFL